MQNVLYMCTYVFSVLLALGRLDCTHNWDFFAVCTCFILNLPPTNSKMYISLFLSMHIHNY
jgi:hypothetical protein